jgi:hypothetical protein
MSAPAGNSTAYSLMLKGCDTVRKAINGDPPDNNGFTVSFHPLADGFELWYTDQRNVTWVSEFVAKGVGRGR